MGLRVIEDKIEGARAFKNSALERMLDELMKLESLLLDLNTEDQLFEQGVTNEGEQIMRYAPYSEVTIEIKKALGQPYDRVTLKDTGDFYQEFQLIRVADGVEIISNDDKAEDLSRSYGPEIFGLTDQNLDQVLLDYLLPELIRYLREKLGIN